MSMLCSRTSVGLAEAAEVLCIMQNVPYVFVPSKAALGRACGVSRPVCDPVV